MHLPNQVRALINALRVQGIGGFLGVMSEKRRKQERYERMLQDVPVNDHKAELRDRTIGKIAIADTTRQAILNRADAMLRDENFYFTFPYRLRGLERPFNYDPQEGLYWPVRHYTEQKLHDEDTPHDVKIVWEINRFKDLPTLAQAAYLTHEKKYADEVEWRLLRWIDDDPFANSINWASGLELGIRLLSWTASIELLRTAGFDLSTNAKIARSIYEQAAYLRAELSTDKIVRSNHLIGEAAGLFATASLWKYHDAEEHANTARAILESEIIRQTYEDGATRESTTWYHGFVTDFFDIAARIADGFDKPFSTQYRDRSAAMKIFRESMVQPDGTPVRIGDADDGWVLYFEGGNEAWFDALFGPSKVSSFRTKSFEISHYGAIVSGESALFIRGGEFGMGGNGSSSHAHDDLLAPVIWLSGVPVLV
ncbi:MAG TPA: heparinase II/III family protein, partial [Candidatus Kapabacteria bacterium]|nr:heparinase II/III family protein [Candidatus Kapabacteria bacterium]